MRVKLAGPVKVGKGQIAHFHAYLKRGAERATIEVHSAVGDYEPSPHVPSYKIQALKDGKPVMVSPSMIRLNPVKPKQYITITADEDCSFYLFQDVDTASEMLAKVRIKGHGNFIAQAFRRIFRNS